MGESAIKEPNAAKMSSATAATVLRLPRSAHRASGTAHINWDTWATKATAPSDALDMWNETCRLWPMSEMPLVNVPGIRAAPVNRTSGA